MNRNFRRCVFWIGLACAVVAAQATLAVAQENSNRAKISVNLMPSDTVEVGSQVSFEVKSARRGYFLLVDIDPTGRMVQLFPNVELLERLKGGDEINLIPANGRIIVPSEEVRKKGYYYLTSAPKGTAAIVVIFSPRKVQLIDLPDSTDETDASKSVHRLARWIDELKIADPASGKLLTNEWSSEAKKYEIR